jgi:threonine dehydratase
MRESAERLTVTLADVESARLRIAGYVHRTPVFSSSQLDRLVDVRLFFKCEVFQKVGAFKARGAFSRLTLLSEEEKARGVVAFSSGNHAQAVAYAARTLGLGATIVMPRDAPASKLAATRGYGARVVLYERASESREGIAARIVSEEGAVLVPPFDDDAVIAGQGTLALELLEEVRDLDVIVTPCGGGGLLSGVAVASRSMRPEVRVYGVEPEAGDDMKRSFDSGALVSISVPPTIADSLQTTRPAERTLRIVRALVDDILLVSDLELRRAMALLASRMKIVVEPGGSAAFAAILAGKVPHLARRRVGVVLSGGNVDPARFGELIASVG